MLRSSRPLARRLLLAALAALAGVPAAAAQGDTTPVVPPAAPPAQPTEQRPTGADTARRPVTDSAWAADRPTNREVGMGHRIHIRTPNLRVPPDTTAKLILFLDGRPMRNVVGQVVDSTGGIVEVVLRRGDSAQSRTAWEPVLGRPGLTPKSVRVGLGYENGREFPQVLGSATQLQLVIIRVRWFILSLALWLAGVAWLVWAAHNRGLLRDTPTAAPEGGAPVTVPVLRKRPYSLARSQMAFWLVLIGSAFVGIWLITGDHHGVMTNGALWLLGIGSLTALGGRLIDAKPADPAKEAQRRAEDEPKSEGFWRDLVSSPDGVAVLHRVQVVFWTLALGAVFVRDVWLRLALPDFDTTLLALLGISGGTYLFGKNVEPHE